MRDYGKGSGGNRRSEHANRENGREVSGHEVLPPQLVRKIGGAIVLLILAGCSQGTVSEPGTLDVYFCPDCEYVFTEFINTLRAKCAFYDLSSKEVIEALQDSEVIVDYQNHEGVGKKVYSEGYMHNKYCVSNDYVLTGSANPTEKGLKENFNNVLVIQSKTLSDNYREEFEELKKGEQKKTRVTKINLSGVLIENYFCPEDGCEEEVLEELRKAKESIRFMTFTFTSDAIGDLLVKKSFTIHVEGLMDSLGLNKYSEYEKLKKAGIPVLMERTRRTLHHKVFIIDNQTVITGSYNPTKSGDERNDENLLIIHDQNITKQYLREFERVKTFLRPGSFARSR